MSSKNLQPRLKRNYNVVKTGCVSCKARHVKCDETKPYCARCILGGRQCVYQQRDKWIFELGSGPTRRQKSVASGVMKHPNGSLGTVGERGLQFYMERVAPALAADNPIAQEFFYHAVPKLARTEDVVKQAMIAVASQLELRHSETGSPKTKELAIGQYASAVSLLARDLAELDGDVLLTTCLMLAVYENIRAEDFASSLTHLISGLSIAQSLPKNAGSALINSVIDPLTLHLELVILMFVSPGRIICSYCSNRPLVPTSFGNLFIACSTLWAIFRWRFHLEACQKLPWTRDGLAYADIAQLLRQWQAALFAYQASVPRTNQAEHRRLLLVATHYSLMEMAFSASVREDLIQKSRVRVLEAESFPDGRIEVTFKVLKPEKEVILMPIDYKIENQDELCIWPAQECIGSQGGMPLVVMTLGVGRSNSGKRKSLTSP